MDRKALRNIQSDAQHDLLERVSFFRALDHFFLRADHLYAVLFQHAVSHEIHRRVQAGLATERWKQRVRTFLADDFFNVLPRDRFDIGPISRVRVRHDGGGIGIDEDHFVALFRSALQAWVPE